VYATLNKFEVVISEDEQAMLESLRPAGDAFKQMLHDVEAMLNRCKVNMKRDLETNISSYNER
jgi:hypothetical protein